MKIKVLMAMLALLITGVCATSCGDDKDDASSSSNSIIGTWVTPDESIKYEFRSNGTGMRTTDAGTQNFEYTFSNSDSSAYLKLWYVNSDSVYNYSVQRTGDTLMLTSGNTTLILKKK